MVVKFFAYDNGDSGKKNIKIVYEGGSSVFFFKFLVLVLLLIVA